MSKLAIMATILNTVMAHEIVFEPHELSCRTKAIPPGAISPCDTFWDNLMYADTKPRCKKVFNSINESGWECSPMNLGMWPSQQISVMYEHAGTFRVKATETSPPANALETLIVFAIMCNYPPLIMIALIIMNQYELCSGVFYIW